MPHEPADGLSAPQLEPQAFPDLAQMLRIRPEQIMQRWDQAVRQVQQVVEGLNLREMSNDMPQILGMLADLLEDPTRQNMQTLVERAPRHGVTRFEQHYDVPQLMSEGRLLRRVVVQHIEDEFRHQMTRDESIALHTGIDILLQGGVLAMVKEQKDALRRDEQRHRLSIEQVQDYAIFMVDPEGRMASWNAGVRQVLGWEEADFLGQPLAVLFPAEEVPAAPEAELRTAREQGHAGNDRWQVKRDGTRFWASGITTAILSERGQLTGYLKVMRDLTEQKLNEERLDKALGTAEEASRAKDHFLAALSHELRTPLSPVVTAAALLLQDPDLPARYRDDVVMIHRNAELEARLIDDLLDVTRIIRGKLELHRKTVPVGEVIGYAVQVCMPEIDARELHLAVALDKAGSCYISVDPGRLQQVFWNLLKNAVKFTPHGGCIGIRSQHELHTGQIAVEVHDSGKGIGPELLPRIFHPFEQGGSSVTRQFGGLGLGLAITKGLVELHGGTIEARSAGPSKGASFIVRLPTVPAPPEPTGSARPDLQERNSGRLRILLVEDHGDTAKIMKRVLGAEGHEVQTASDVASALDAFGRREFDLLVSDLGLPDGNGTDIVRSIREHGRTVPAIALSGYGQEEDIRRSKEAGFTEHLIKPVDIIRLKQTVRRLGQSAV